ncbi:MAG: DUF2231 domain-containing protein [Candidatus Binatia bacterium]
MRSMASIGKHPVHPALVAIPIGAFAVALVSDVLRIISGAPEWGTTARHALMIGVVTAVLAAVVGLVDYLFIAMSPSAKRLATFHLVLNLGAVALFVVSFLVRQSAPAGWSLGGFLISIFAFLVLGAAGWIGGELVFRHKVGVVEGADPQATTIGKREEKADRPGIELTPEPRRR